ncbi:MAG: sigma-54-dependent Fis family transcriptional regulator, partial [Novosphingobium sp.]|nr:sigma-54-dependent Fis family transcriptional regulator [Novosphingobium sp.]
AIHGESHRNGQPFIAVNCGAIPLQLAESTLFGHEKGAFTGATEKTTGKFREAEGGTIFLDEIGELPLDTQVKLLRVLQQKEVEPVGANRPVPVNVRIISATNRDLRKEVAEGRFREDLFFRLNVLQIEMPPLRNRYQDIPALAAHFIERFCANEGGIPKELSPHTEEALLAYPWPGNVRQLENVINRAMVLSEGNVLDIEDLPGLALSSDISPTTAANSVFDHKAEDLSEEHFLEKDTPSIRMTGHEGHFKTLDTIEREAMAIALEHFNHNITQAAKALGMAKSTFYKKMKPL